MEIYPSSFGELIKKYCAYRAYVTKDIQRLNELILTSQTYSFSRMTLDWRKVFSIMNDVEMIIIQLNTVLKDVLDSDEIEERLSVIWQGYTEIEEYLDKELIRGEIYDREHIMNILNNVFVNNVYAKITLEEYETVNLNDLRAFGIHLEGISKDPESGKYLTYQIL